MTRDEFLELREGDLILVEANDFKGAHPLLLVSRFIRVQDKYVICERNGNTFAISFVAVEAQLFSLATLLQRLVKEYP